MPTVTSNIDDVLSASMAGVALSAEPEQVINEEPEIHEEIAKEPESFDYGYSNEPKEKEVEKITEETKLSEEDEYGNKEEAGNDNEIIRERLARQAESMNRKHQQEIEDLKRQLMQNQTQQVQQAVQDFEHDPNQSGDWQTQLAQFVKQTVNNMSYEQQQAHERQREAQIQTEFETKFHQGMSKFVDYRDVVGTQPITDAMTIATRGMKDPAAFLYAASKRTPEELQRISKIPDQYTQMVEMGRLEERLRQTKPGTKTPKPLSNIKGDRTVEHKKEREPSLDELLMQSDAKRRAQLKTRRR